MIDSGTVHYEMFKDDNTVVFISVFISERLMVYIITKHGNHTHMTIKKIFEPIIVLVQAQ